MTYSEQLRRHYGFGTGDRIVVPKSGWNIVQHHAVFFGNVDGEAFVAENKEGQCVVLTRLDQFLADAGRITRVESFTGVYDEQVAIMKRIQERLGRRYDRWKYNCEHFVNEVLHLNSISPQVKNFGKGLAVAGGLYLLYRLLK